MRKALLLLVVLAGIVAGCEDKYKDPDPQAMGYDYYPLEIGAYRIYNVTDIKFRNNVGDTSRFQMKERIDTSFYDQTEHLNYKIVRSVRPDENSSWTDDSVMVVRLSENSLLLSKDNTTFVKLIFPVKNGRVWAGDALNNHIVDSDEFDTQILNKNLKEPYTYINVGAGFQVSNQNFTNTATVIEGNSVKNYVYLDDRKEVYAEGVGRIYRLFNRVEFAPCNPDQCDYGEEYILDGHERHEELISYGTR